MGKPSQPPRPHGEADQLASGLRSGPQGCLSLQRGASVPPTQPEPWPPLRPALLNGYKLEDKSAGFQAILPSISGNRRSPGSGTGMEEERRKTLRVRGAASCSKQTRTGPFCLDLGGETKLSLGGSGAPARATHAGSCHSWSTYCVPGTAPGQWGARRQVNKGAGPLPWGLRTWGAQRRGWLASQVDGGQSAEVTFHSFTPQTFIVPRGGRLERH